METPKVFHIGLPRTGTQSLTGALKILGYRTVHAPSMWSEIDAYEACTEVMHSLPDLQTRYPHALYILTVRDSESWLASVAKVAPNAARGWNPFWFIPANQRLAHHVDRIAEAVKLISTDSLLLINICAGEGWESLCSFLSLPEPRVPFPRRDQVG